MKTLSILAAGLLMCAGAAVAQDAGVDKDIANYEAKLDAEQQRKADATAAVHVKELAQDSASPFFGNPKADVTIVVFSDYQCPYCKAAEPRLMKLAAEDGNLKVVLKEFPILGPESLVASKAALAAVKQNKYAAYHQAMMANRGQLTNEVIFGTAKTVGLDVERLRKDMESSDIANQLLDNFILARSLKLTVTPAFIVDTHVLSGLTPKTSTSKIDFAAEVAAVRTARKK